MSCCTHLVRDWRSCVLVKGRDVLECRSHHGHETERHDQRSRRVSGTMAARVWAGIILEPPHPFGRQRRRKGRTTPRVDLLECNLAAGHHSRASTPIRSTETEEGPNNSQGGLTRMQLYCQTRRKYPKDWHLIEAGLVPRE